MASTRPAPVIAYTTWQSPLGEMILAASAAGLCGLWFTGQKYAPAKKSWPRRDDDPRLRSAIAQLQEFFGRRRRSFDLPLDLSSGTVFQRSVWRALQRIPAGQTASYGDLARRVGRPQAARAAAAAIGRNPLSILVPCHRVIGRDGSLTGYAGGLDRKAALLALEGVSSAARR